MVIGRGMIAQEFKEYVQNDKYIIFASGVSNSKENKAEAFLKEKELLLKTISELGDKCLIYFSTCSMYDKYIELSLYTKHKVEMEKLIQDNSKNFFIFRLPQVVGVNNKHQLMGFLFNKIKNEEFFDLYDIERNIVDIEDIKYIIDDILLVSSNNSYKNRIINIASPNNIKVIDLVKKMENILELKANFKILRKEGNFIIDIKDISQILDKLGAFDENYIDKVIKKYYE